MAKFSSRIDRKVFARRFISITLLFAVIFVCGQFVYLRRGNNGDPLCIRSGHGCVFQFLHGSTDVNSYFPATKKSQGYGYEINAVVKRFPPISSTYNSDSLKPRYSFKSYEEYIQLQLKKTLNPKLRKLWTSKDWRRKVDVFSSVFQSLINKGILKRQDKALCIAARVGQEVLALREIGVDDSIGVDLVPSAPLVVQGDMHTLPFEDNSFDFEFSNAFDHALYPVMFASEVERTLKPGGIVVLHLSLTHRTDKYSANDLISLEPVLQLFKNFKVIHVHDIDVFGLDVEIVLKKLSSPSAAVTQKCLPSRLKEKIIENAEPLIEDEPRKPWITLKENAKKIKYLPAYTNISNHTRHLYIDVGARNYDSSIGSWFVKKYPKQNNSFVIYAVEAEKTFFKDYDKRKNVRLLPYAAWVKNESLVFGANPENRAAEGEIGMGRIRTLADVKDEATDFQTVQGFDFSEWLLKTVSMDDFVVLKMDIEGTEFDLLPQMLESGALCRVDELFLECHYDRWQRTSPDRTSKYKRTYDQCLSLFQTLRSNGVLVHQWW